LLPDGHVAKGDGAVPIDDAAEAAASAQHSRKEYERTRVEMVRGYAETSGCRRSTSSATSGKAFAAPCGNCDNCDAGRTHAERGTASRSRSDRASVTPSSADGTVQRYGGDTVVVLFDEHGYRTLGLEIVEERGLLRDV
jgi:ATP-dependent DNA helicase RecQ